jgi:hypothetical protein
MRHSIGGTLKLSMDVERPGYHMHPQCDICGVFKDGLGQVLKLSGRLNSEHCSSSVLRRYVGICLPFECPQGVGDLDQT